LYLLIEVLLEADVAARENTDRSVALDYRQPRNLMTPHQLECIVQRLPRPYRHGVHDHARLCALDLGDLERLELRAHVLVQNADAAFASHRHRGPPLGHRVHRARHEGDAQLDLPRKASGNVRIRGQKIRVRRQEQHVIEGECFP